jgi:hypothetical protein
MNRTDRNARLVRLERRFPATPANPDTFELIVADFGDRRAILEAARERGACNVWFIPPKGEPEIVEVPRPGNRTRTAVVIEGSSVPADPARPFESCSSDQLRTLLVWVQNEMRQNG